MLPVNKTTESFVVPVFGRDNFKAPFGSTAAYSAMVELAGNMPVAPEVKLPLIFLSFTLIITEGVPGDDKTNLTNALPVGRSYSVALSSDFWQALKP